MIVRSEQQTSQRQRILGELGVREDGLTHVQVEEVRAAVGCNEVREYRKPWWKLFVSQFRDVLVLLLLAAAAASLAVPLLREGRLGPEDGINAVVILAIVVLNAVLGFFQESRAERAIALLRQLSAPHVKVRRDGRISILPARELLPGDVMLLEAGDRVSADARIVVSASLETDESSLTGESVPVAKSAQEHCPNDIGSPGMVLSGTLVTRGSAEVVVTATGYRSEIGKIATMVMELESPSTPLQLQLKKAGKLIGLLVVALCAAIFVFGILKGMPLTEMFFTAVSLAVAAVPEGLPAIVTICLAIGVQRMIGKHALIRRLDAVETLGCVTVICADKTGTITENRMRVERIWTAEEVEREAVLEAAASCNRAELPDIGDPTELALLAAAEEGRIERLPIADEEVPFTSEAKYMVTVHERDGERLRYLKGAPEVVAKFCRGDMSVMLRESERLSAAGSRVLAVARGEPCAVKLLGLIALIDAPRAQVAHSIGEARRAGVRTIMITGDHPATALAVARSVGIVTDKVIDGTQLERMGTAELKDALRETSVFARVQPVHKVKILTSLQETGEVVAMSGDGVNDAPALKRAHVGIAMGMKGTDIARESAAMVLTDDNYATIVAAIAEGRRIYDNIRKFVLFLMRANVGEIAIVAVAMFIGLPLPLLPLHILWINLVTDSFPALSLAAEEGEADNMLRPPRRSGEGIFTGEWTLLFLAAFLNAAASLGMYAYVLSDPGNSLVIARTTALTTTILFQLFLAFSTHTKRVVFREPLLQNRWLLGAIGLSIIVHLLLLYTPLGAFFSVLPLPLTVWVQMLAVTFVAFLLLEAAKVVLRGKPGEVSY